MLTFLTLPSAISKTSFVNSTKENQGNEDIFLLHLDCSFSAFVKSFYSVFYCFFTFSTFLLFQNSLDFRHTRHSTPPPISITIHSKRDLFKKILFHLREFSPIFHFLSHVLLLSVLFAVLLISTVFFAFPFDFFRFLHDETKHREQKKEVFLPAKHM
jgi:hypothetical protein